MSTNIISNQKTIQQIVDSSAKSASGRNTGDLGKDDFLNLLVTQLQNQDPLNPTDDKEFIGQMAQFTSLEQMKNMNTSMAQSQAYSLVGKHIAATITDDTTKVTSKVDGTVTGVKIANGVAYAQVNGKDVEIDKITEVTDGANPGYASLSQYTGLIGLNADGFAYDASTGNIAPVSGIVSSLAKGQNEDYALMDGVNIKVTGIVGGTASSDPDYVKNYLESKKGSQISVYVKNESTGEQVPVTGVLESYTADGNGVKAIMNKVSVPVASITDVTPENKESNQEVLLQKILDKLSQNNSGT